MNTVESSTDNPWISPTQKDRWNVVSIMDTADAVMRIVRDQKSWMEKSEPVPIDVMQQAQALMMREIVRGEVSEAMTESTARYWFNRCMKEYMDELEEATNEDLVEEFVQGGKKSALIFEIIVRRTWDTVIRALITKYGSTDPEDIAQIAFARFFKNAEKYDSEKGEFIAWLMQMAFHIAIDIQRGHRPEIEFNPHIHTAAGRQRSVYQGIIDAEERERVESFLNKLAESREKNEQQMAAYIRAYFIDGKTYEQIAEEATTSLSTVYQRVRAGLGLLRSHMQGNLQ